MTTRERIEAEIDVLTDQACRAMLSGNIVTNLTLAGSIERLRSILTDLPATTPPTLAEFRESGEKFLWRGDSWMRILEWDTYAASFYEPATSDYYSDVSIGEIKRICDPTWTRVEEDG